MKTAVFRFYEELNDFLPKAWRKLPFSYAFSGSPKLREMMVMLGVPPAEIDLILVNGMSVDFDYVLHEGDHVSIYPVFESLDISPVTHLQARPLRQVKFILDVHLGRLAKYLRICGFDTYYDSLDDDEIINIALQEKRIILSKDKGLLKQREVTHGYFVRAVKPREQLLEIIRRFDLNRKIQFLVRCLLCNRKLQIINQEEIKDVVPGKTAEFYIIFYHCSQCKKIYWHGAHYNNMLKLLRWVNENIQEEK